MTKFIESILGENWRTSLWGSIMLLALAINQAPTIIDFLPADMRVWVRGISGLIVIASGLKFAASAKDK